MVNIAAGTEEIEAGGGGRIEDGEEDREVEVGGEIELEDLRKQECRLIRIAHLSAPDKSGNGPLVD